MGRGACPPPPRAQPRGGDRNKRRRRLRDSCLAPELYAGVRLNHLAGGTGGAAIPVPIPNTAVKGPSGDDTAPRSAGK